MPAALERSENQCLLRLEGEINLAGAPELKELLVEALASTTTELLVDFEQATELDTAGMQLLWAAGLMVRVTAVGPVPAAIAGAVRDAGLARFPGVTAQE